MKIVKARRRAVAMHMGRRDGRRRLATLPVT